MNLNINMDKQRILYKRIFLIYSIFLTTEFAYIDKLSIAKWVMVIWGIFLIAYDAFKSKGKTILKDVILLSFAIVGLVTIAVNRKIDGSLILYLTTLVQMFMLNSFNVRMRVDMIKKEIIRLNTLVIGLTFGISLVGLVQYVAEIKDIGILIHIWDISHNFKGLYITSDAASIVAYISIMAATILIVTNRANDFTKKFNVFCYANILLQGCMLIISRNIESIMGVAIFYGIILFMMIPKKNIRIVIAVLCIIVSVSTIIASKTMAVNDSSILASIKQSDGIWNFEFDDSVREHPVVGNGYDTYMEKWISENESNTYSGIIHVNGILGFISFAAFLSGAMGVLYSKAFYNDLFEDERLFIKLIFSVLLSIIIMGMMKSMMIYIITMMSTFFWIYMGYAQYLIKRYR